MSKELLTFGNIKTENKKLYPHKTNFLGDVDIEKCYCLTWVSTLSTLCTFISTLLVTYVVKTLNIMLPKTSSHVKGYDGQT